MKALLVVLALVVAVPASAQGADDHRFKALDYNRDGHLSLSEAAGNEDIVVRFDRADRNRDGKLSSKEYARLDRIKLRVAKAKKPDERSAAVGGSAAPARKRSVAAE